MAAVTLKAERPSLTVDVGGEREVKVPLTFTHPEYVEIGGMDPGEGMLEFFRKYLGDVIDEVGDDDLAALMKAWAEARAALGEPALGESSASPSR